MSKLVVIRVGNPTGSWAQSVERGFISTPESQVQHARNLFMEGNEVIALFVGTGDILLGMSKISSIRSRATTDTSNIDLQTFMTFTKSDYIDILTADITVFEKVLAYIKYRQGQQIVPDTECSCTCQHVLAFYKGVIHSRSLAPAVVPRLVAPLNTTVILNPELQ